MSTDPAADGAPKVPGGSVSSTFLPFPGERFACCLMALFDDSGNIRKHHKSRGLLAFIEAKKGYLDLPFVNLLRQCIGFIAPVLRCQLQRNYRDATEVGQEHFECSHVLLRMFATEEVGAVCSTEKNFFFRKITPDHKLGRRTERADVRYLAGNQMVIHYSSTQSSQCHFLNLSPFFSMFT